MEEVELEEKERWDGWSEGEDRRHVRGFHSLSPVCQSSTHPLTENKVFSSKAKVLRRKHFKIKSASGAVVAGAGFRETK